MGTQRLEFSSVTAVRPCCVSDDTCKWKGSDSSAGCWAPVTGVMGSARRRGLKARCTGNRVLQVPCETALISLLKGLRTSHWQWCKSISGWRTVSGFFFFWKELYKEKYSWFLFVTCLKITLRWKDYFKHRAAMKWTSLLALFFSRKHFVLFCLLEHLPAGMVCMHGLDRREVEKSFALLICVISNSDTLQYWHDMALGALVM